MTPRTWVLLGDKGGDNGQVETIVQALGWPVEHKYVHMLPEYVLGKPRYGPSLHHIDPERSDPLSPPWPDLIITVGRSPANVALWVKDHGIGISREEQEKIFERFHRVSTGLVHDVKGSGLGLSLVRHIAESHGGTVTVESEVGKGSTFTIHLPLRRSEGEQA